MTTGTLSRVARTVGVLLGLGVGLAGAGVIAALRRPLPRTSGRIHLPGLHAPVEVIRDCWGVPHIYAASTADLFAAQGYVHAQDRLWQMEQSRRLASGQLAEVFGEQMLDTDRFVRILGLRRIATREAELLDGDARVAVEAYVRGINAFIHQNPNRLPIEFSMLRLRPRLWEPTDVLTIGKILAHTLSGSWDLKLLRARIVAAVGAERAAQLEPGYPTDQPLSVPDGVSYPPDIGEEALRTAAASPFSTSDLPGQGSNAWVVGGTRTASGRPLLSNDPHLAIQMPSLWYENHLSGGSYHVTGVSLPGAPGVIIGHNERIAWGVTNAPVEVQDLYIERFDPHDPTRYEFGGAWERATVVREEIAVRGRAEPHIEEVRITRHGPIVSALSGRYETIRDPGPAKNGEPKTKNQGPGTATNASATQNSTHKPQPSPEALALRWTALEPTRLIYAVLSVNRAHDWGSFRAALNDWTVPPQNFVYADIEGHFGYTLGGHVPVRASGDTRVPMPGWTGEHEWIGIIPPADLPHALDPADGLAVTANNRIVGDSYPYQLPGNWMPGYRAARIETLLRQTRLHTADSFARIQSDQICLPGLQIAALAPRLPVDSVTAQHARDALAAWDGELGTDSIGGTIYASLREHLLRETHAEIREPLGLVTGSGLFDALPRNFFLLRTLPELLRRIAANDESGMPAGRTWDSILATAWAAALAELRAAYGDDVREWRYGRSHVLRFQHALGVVPALAPLFNRGPFPIGGDLDTVSMGFVPRRHDDRHVTVMPSYRHICDTDNWDNSRSIHASGQSGHPGSGHYDDFIGPWLETRAHPMLWSRPLIEDAAEATLVLHPTAQPARRKG
ncbi:MAG TPA: penicillin acylase family protein [Roseiflexaceae bacterium]|nr:penicillin acylase family protein [Roseiflexaceae bacterium]